MPTPANIHVTKFINLSLFLGLFLTCVFAGVGSLDFWRREKPAFGETAAKYAKAQVDDGYWQL